MAHRQKSRIMVCDDDARVVGVISLSDIAQLEPAAYTGFMLRRVTRRAEGPARVDPAARCADAMKTVVVCVGPDHAVGDAARFMRDHDLGFLPVCQADRVLLYVVTDRDLALSAVADDLDARAPLRDVLPPRDLVTCGPDDPLSRAEELMATHRKSRLPVVDADGRLVGVLSLSAIARHAAPDASGATLRDVSSREAS